MATANTFASIRTAEGEAAPGKRDGTVQPGSSRVPSPTLHNSGNGSGYGTFSGAAPGKTGQPAQQKALVDLNNPPRARQLAKHQGAVDPGQLQRSRAAVNPGQPEGSRVAAHERQPQQPPVAVQHPRSRATVGHAHPQVLADMRQQQPRPGAAADNGSNHPAQPSRAAIANDHDSHDDDVDQDLPDVLQLDRPGDQHSPRIPDSERQYTTSSAPAPSAAAAPSATAASAATSRASAAVRTGERVLLHQAGDLAHAAWKGASATQGLSATAFSSGRAGTARYPAATPSLTLSQHRFRFVDDTEQTEEAPVACSSATAAAAAAAAPEHASSAAAAGNSDGTLALKTQGAIISADDPQPLAQPTDVCKILHSTFTVPPPSAVSSSFSQLHHKLQVSSAHIPQSNPASDHAEDHFAHLDADHAAAVDSLEQAAQQQVANQTFFNTFCQRSRSFVQTVVVANDTRFHAAQPLTVVPNIPDNFAVGSYIKSVTARTPNMESVNRLFTKFSLGYGPAQLARPGVETTEALVHTVGRAYFFDSAFKVVTGGKAQMPQKITLQPVEFYLCTALITNIGVPRLLITVMAYATAKRQDLRNSHGVVLPPEGLRPSLQVDLDLPQSCIEYLAGSVTERATIAAAAEDFDDWWQEKVVPQISYQVQWLTHLVQKPDQGFFSSEESACFVGKITQAAICVQTEAAPLALQMPYLNFIFKERLNELHPPNADGECSYTIATLYNYLSTFESFMLSLVTDKPYDSLTLGGLLGSSSADLSGAPAHDPFITVKLTREEYLEKVGNGEISHDGPLPIAADDDGSQTIVCRLPASHADSCEVPAPPEMLIATAKSRSVVRDGSCDWAFCMAADQPEDAEPILRLRAGRLRYLQGLDHYLRATNHTAHIAAQAFEVNNKHVMETLSTMKENVVRQIAGTLRLPLEEARVYVLEDGGIDMDRFHAAIAHSQVDVLGDEGHRQPRTMAVTLEDLQVENRSLKKRLQDSTATYNRVVKERNKLETQKARAEEERERVRAQLDRVRPAAQTMLLFEAAIANVAATAGTAPSATNRHQVFKMLDKLVPTACMAQKNLASGRQTYNEAIYSLAECVLATFRLIAQSGGPLCREAEDIECRLQYHIEPDKARKKWMDYRANTLQWLNLESADTQRRLTVPWQKLIADEPKNADLSRVPKSVFCSWKEALGAILPGDYGSQPMEDTLADDTDEEEDSGARSADQQPAAKRAKPE